MNNESVGKKIVEALKKQAESMDIEESIDSSLFTERTQETVSENIFESNNDIFAEPIAPAKPSFFDDVEDIKEPIFTEPQSHSSTIEASTDSFEMPANIAVLKKLISQLPSGVSRHTGAQIIKQTMEALGISMKSVLKEAQEVQDGLKDSARDCHATIQEYKKQIALLEKQSQNFQRQSGALNDLISLFIQTTK